MSAQHIVQRIRDQYIHSALAKLYTFSRLELYCKYKLEYICEDY